jgi:hypothetical protein
MHAPQLFATTPSQAARISVPVGTAKSTPV